MYEEEEELPCVAPSSATSPSRSPLLTPANGPNNPRNGDIGMASSTRSDGANTCMSSIKRHIVETGMLEAVRDRQNSVDKIDADDDSLQLCIQYIPAKQRRLDAHARSVQCAMSSDANNRNNSSTNLVDDSVSGMVRSGVNSVYRSNSTAAQVKGSKTENKAVTLDSYSDGRLPDDTDIAQDETEFAAWKLRQARRPVAFI